MNFSALAYKFITGEWRLDRERARAYAAHEQRDLARRMQLYAGAEPGNKRPTPNYLSTPEDYKQAYERIVLIRGARQMEEDFPFFDGILGDFSTYVIGDLKFIPSTGSAEADAVIRDFLDWQFDQCDYSQRQDLTSLSRLAIRSMKRDGECGFIMVDQGDTIKVSAIEGDRIGNPMMGANIGAGNYNGIIVEEITGAPIFYDIFLRIPKLNSYEFQQKVRANDFIHYYDPFRFSQYHGVTCFKNSIEHSFDIKQITDFTKLNIKWRSAQLPYVTNEQGRPRGNGYESVPASLNGVPQPLQTNVDGVTQTYLKLDEGIMNYPNDFPNQQFSALMTELKRDCAVGCKLPLEFCYRSESGGVVQRFYVNKAEQTFNEEKRHIKRTLLNPFKNRLIQKGIDTGFLDLSKFGELGRSMKRFSGTWQMGKAISVDYKNEVSSDIQLMDAGVMSPSDYAAENGKDLAAILADIEQHTLNVFRAAERIAKETGQDINTVLPYIKKVFPNPVMAPAEKAPLDAAAESVSP